MPEHAKVYGSHVSRLLAAAGFSRATGRNPGYVALGEHRSWAAGLLDDPASACVTVQHRPAAHCGADLTPYALALEDAGLAVEHQIHGTQHYLVVRGRRARSSD